MLVGRSSGSRTQAHSCPLGPTGVVGGVMGVTGEREQWGPEQGAWFFAGKEGRSGAATGSSSFGDTITA